MTPTDPTKPAGDDRPDRRGAARPGGHGSYKLGGEPATGHSWHEAPPPPPARPRRCRRASNDDGVPHRHHEPGEEDPLHNEDVDHEHSDINIRAVIGSAIILIVVVIVSQVADVGTVRRVRETGGSQRSGRFAARRSRRRRCRRTTQGTPVFNAGDRRRTAADDQRADEPAASSATRSRSGCTATAGSTRAPASRACRSTRPRS